MADKSWLANYDTGVRASLEPYPQKTLVDYVHETATQRPKHPALWFPSQRVPSGRINCTRAHRAQ